LRRPAGCGGVCGEPTDHVIGAIGSSPTAFTFWIDAANAAFADARTNDEVTRILCEMAERLEFYKDGRNLVAGD
jgi:hypothetical protein